MRDERHNHRMAFRGLWHPEDQPAGAGRVTTAEQRLVLMRALCRDAIKILRLLPEDQRARSMRYQQPIPASSVDVLRRLREQFRSTKGNG